MIEELGTKLRSASATLGLMLGSAVVVHLVDGVIEAHFLFFVMVAVVALYQDWLPFLLALGFVVLHHTVVGTLAPQAVYNHQDANDHPLLWGLIHGGFILAESLVCLVYWRAGERAVQRERASLLVSQKGHRDLADAQVISGMGSWEWDVASDVVTWSSHLFDVMGVDEQTLSPTVDSFLQLVHPDDQDRVAATVAASAQTGSPLVYEGRVVRPDGQVRTVHALGSCLTDVDGAVVHIRGIVHDITERTRLQKTIRRMAYQDSLTGLGNRRVFLQRLDEVLSPDADVDCAILFVDLDDVKAVNDRDGHAAGDALLREIGTRLQTSVRDSDLVARFGGDEFAILCTGADHEVALMTTQRVENQLRRSTLIEGVDMKIEASIGIAVAVHGDTADGLLRRADAAMYRVKDRRKQLPRALSPAAETTAPTSA